MFRFTQEPSSGSHNQSLAKIYNLEPNTEYSQVSSDHTENDMANVSMNCYDCLRTRFIQAHNFRIRRKLWVRLQYPALGSQPAGRRQCTTVIF